MKPRVAVTWRWIAMVAVGAVLAAVGWAAELRIEIEPRWEGARVAVPSGELKNGAGQVVRITRLAALVSGVVLHRADGGTVRLEGQYGYVDGERERGAIELTGVPAGEYVGLEFRVGLPADVNHGDVAQWPARHALNPLVNGLHWSWQGGYVFFALEGRWRETRAGGGEADERGVAGAGGGSEERGFLYHVATDARVMAVRFAADFRVREATTVKLALEVGRVLRDVRLVAGDGSESTHSGEGDPLAAKLAVAVERAWFWLGAEETKDGIPASPRKATGVAAAGERAKAEARPVAFVVPAGFPQPELPADNPLTAEGVALGRRLFSDTRLSGNGTQTCASCHAEERAFSDTVALSVGAEGTAGARNAMPLFNLAWSGTFAWDGGKARVRDQALAAMENPIEMNAAPERVVAALRADAAVRGEFAAAFGSEEVTAERVGLALEQFLLTIVHADSQFDRALRGAARLSEEAQRGFELFMTEYDPARGRIGADCFHCHGGALFTDFGFKNNGLAAAGGSAGGGGGVGPADRGREGVTAKTGDRGKFKTPSLRNVALTAPYMHDGRFATLEEVVAHYDHGVERSATLDANLAKHPAGGMKLTGADQRALVAFLRTLTEAGGEAWEAGGATFTDREFRDTGERSRRDGSGGTQGRARGSVVAR